MSDAPKRILFIHPDLGIGGAERLVVDAAVGLQERGHAVTIYTSHCDPRHCFDEARNGTLNIRVAGNTLIPPNILGRFSILCAILRQLHLTLTLLLSGELSTYDYLFIDQLSACIPLIRIFSPKLAILFYCHFPDYLLAARKSLVKRLYRIPFDFLEGATTGKAHAVVVNSNFTKSVFKTAFPGINTEPRVVYPCVDVKEKPKGRMSQGKVEVFFTDLEGSGRKTLLSINRFERKKNIELAILSFAGLSSEERKKTRLVIAGGYDYRVRENREYHQELEGLCDKEGLRHTTCHNFISSLDVPANTDVLFLQSIPANWKAYLLSSASLLLYTPEREHFGIVPLEAAVAKIPVLAHNSGGPLETIKEGVTGWLRPDVPEEWTKVIRKALFELSQEVEEMGRKAREKAVAEFSKEKMAERIEKEFRLIKTKDESVLGALVAVTGLMAVGVAVGVMFLL
ncbi:hypothetical protein BZA77DRAFT_356053 [Pyronema omphalodes]|nr:hypothetical protein BZA77DRAFT_356053 [Pyronema omphalodes]